MALEISNITQIKYSNTAGTCEIKFEVDVCLVRRNGNAYYYTKGSSLLTSGDNGKMVEGVLNDAREPYCIFNI